MNQQKCTFRIIARKLIRHIVSEKRIEVDPSKIKVIMEMTYPQTKKEIRGFLRRLEYINRFIAQFTITYELYFWLMKKEVPTI